MWPAVAVGALLANLTTAAPLGAALGIATGNTLEAVVGAYLLRRVGFRPSLERVDDVVALVVFGAALSTMVSATFGVASLLAAGLVAEADIISTWRVWWLGDAGGELIVAPALLILASRPRLERRPWIRVEGAALAIALVGVSAIVFSTPYALVYIVFPVLFWIGLRFRQPGTAIGGLIVCGIAVWFTSRGDGPFVGGSADAELLSAQLFVGVVMITGLLVAALVTERRRVEAQLKHQADHDPLTGLLNRRRFEQELERWVAHRTRYGGRGAVLVMDVDNLKSVNDQLGHAAGDELLTRVAEALKEQLRETDVVARLGGDEFTVLLPLAGEDRALAVAGALLERVREGAAVSGDEGATQATLSIGVSSFGEGLDLDAERVLASADMALYRAKAGGRDQVRVEGAV
jgi:diguanylate cyclase (GGDEF)-like protein